jgi:hypothetical protein
LVKPRNFLLHLKVTLSFLRDSTALAEWHFENWSQGQQVAPWTVKKEEEAGEAMSES